jgi:glucuronosyltransferase
MIFCTIVYVNIIIHGLLLINMAESFKILGIFAHIGKSHFDVFEPYLEQLAARGHQVTVVSHFPPKYSIPNYKIIDLRGTTKLDKTVNIISHLVIPQMGQLESALVLSEWGADACDKTFQHPSVQELIKSDEKFDLLITEMFNTDCFLAFAHKFKIPVIGFSSCVFMPWTPGRFGNPDNPAYIPTHFVLYSDKMSFMERFRNTFWYVLHHLHYPFLMDSPAHNLARQHFGESLPALSYLARNTSLIFVNNHFSLNRPRPLVPGVIEVAGIHIKQAKMLPKVRWLWLLHCYRPQQRHHSYNVFALVSEEMRMVQGHSICRAEGTYYSRPFVYIPGIVSWYSVWTMRLGNLAKREHD